MSKFITVIGAFALLIALVAVGPILVLWAWNTLFGSALTIPLTLETWVSVIILGAFISPNVTIKRKS